MDIADLWRVDATGQAALVRGGEVTAGELLDAAIARIDALNPRINAVITPMYEQARRHANSTDLDAPFAGVPMLVKHACLQVEGTPYWLGLRAMRDADYRSDHTTELARRLRRAGFSFAGKTNVPELSATASTEPPAFGPTRNPWDLTRTPGGSSGGSAAAVASGMVSIAHGADGGGSLRYPAAACGVVTLKPSRGRVPSETPTGEPDLLNTWAEFVLARSVRDLAGVLDAAGGPAPGDASTLSVPDGGFSAALARGSSALRVGLLTRDVMAGMGVDAECAAAVEGAGRLLESLGHRVEDAHPPALDGLLVRLWPQLQSVLAVGRLPLFAWIERAIGRPLTPDDLEEPLVREADAGGVSGVQLAQALVSIAQEAAAVRRWWSGDDAFDLLVTPVLRQPPWPLGGKGAATDAGVFPFPFSLTWQPAMSLPLHWTPSGLPAGVQIVAAYGRDDVLLRVAAQLEQAAPWADRWPGIENSWQDVARPSRSPKREPPT
jgi:amidase